MTLNLTNTDVDKVEEIAQDMFEEALEHEVCMRFLHEYGERFGVGFSDFTDGDEKYWAAYNELYNHIMRELAKKLLTNPMTMETIRLEQRAHP